MAEEQQEALTDETALGVVDQVCARFQGSRQDHVTLVRAIEHIKGRLAGNPVPVAPPPISRPEKRRKKKQ